MPARASAISCRHLGVVEGVVFGGRLHLDEAAGARHHDVHIDVRLRVLFVAEIEHGDAADQPDTGGRHVIADRHLLELAVLDQLAEGQRHRDEGAGDRRRARAAIGLQHVAIEHHGALAERAHIDDRRASSGRSAAGFRACVRRAGPC